jgi:ankyrin repeat protein
MVKKSLPARVLPKHPDLDQLKRQAKEFLDAVRAGEPDAVAEAAARYPGADPQKFALHDAQLVLARAHGFHSWPRLRAYVSGGMIKAPEMESDSGRDVWDTITAAAAGDTLTLQRLMERDPSLSRAEYFYAPPIHFAVREGHGEAVRILLEAGAAESEWNGCDLDGLIEIAKDRSYEEIALLLDEVRRRRRPVAPLEDHPIHAFAERGDVEQVRDLLHGDATLLNRRDAGGRTPLHRAVKGSAHEVIALLLDRGADMNATDGKDWQALDHAIWRRRAHSTASGAFDTARLLLSRGATCDLTIAAALGDLPRVTALLDQKPACLHEVRPNGKRALSAAVQFGHREIARLLLERGADPNWPEADAPRGASLHAAAGAGDRELVELLLAHSADPNGHVESAGNAVYAAKTPELRALLMGRGGTLDPYDLVWLDEDDEVIRRVTEDPDSAEYGCGGVFTAVCTRGKRDLLLRLLDAGIRVPPVVTGCHSYLLEDTEMLRILLASGMNPDLPTWQRRTFLHDLCSGGKRGQTADAIERAQILLDAGASLLARDEEYRSTPLAWAARTNMREMVEFLLARGAPTNLPDDAPWATPLAWAERRGHAEIAEILRKSGAAR